VLLEMSGSPAAYDQGFSALRNGGIAALAGHPRQAANVQHHAARGLQGRDGLGINGRRMFETWYQMEELLLSGKLELDDIITHEFPLEQFEKAHETMISGEGIKVVMSVNG
jgi:threonine 3-dehydrogenase